MVHAHRYLIADILIPLIRQSLIDINVLGDGYVNKLRDVDSLIKKFNLTY